MLFSRFIPTRWKSKIVWTTRRFKPNVITGFHLYHLPLIASYSRSGTNLVRYAIEYISGRPTPGQPRIHSADSAPYIVDRAHKAYPVIPKHTKVILLLRNYKECLLRHHKDLWFDLKDVDRFLNATNIDQPPSWYIKNIISFDRHDDRLLVYYEDLLTDPGNQLKKVADFIHLDQDRTDSFINNLDEHLALSANRYRSGGHSTESLGSGNLAHHSGELLTEHQNREFDSYFEDNYPDLFEKYLHRYAG